jgi:DNA-binding GntR family transcriptional regulator
MQTTVAEQVYAHLLSRILHNELKSGYWVERKQLAEDMKTSLMPIAEAVQRLTLEGFLVSVPLTLHHEKTYHFAYASTRT